VGCTAYSQDKHLWSLWTGSPLQNFQTLESLSEVLVHDKKMAVIETMQSTAVPLPFNLEWSLSINTNCFHQKD
jgi:hypothetical protein